MVSASTKAMKTGESYPSGFLRFGSRDDVIKDLRCRLCRT